MIEFDCPECGEPMEISDRMAGKRTRCLECDARIDVPERSRRRGRREDDDSEDYDDRVERKRRRRGRAVDDAGLEPQTLTLFALLFLVVPCANVLISSILYYVWKLDHPRKANQINLLGFAIFGLHIVVAVLLAVLDKR